MHNVKLTILNILSLQLSGLKNIHVVVQPLPLSVSRTFLFSPIKTLSALNTASPAPGNLHSTFCPYDSDSSRNFI